MRKIAFASLVSVGSLSVQAAENDYGAYHCMIGSPSIPGAATPSYRCNEDQDQTENVEKLHSINVYDRIINILNDAESLYEEKRKTDKRLDSDLKSKRILADVFLQTIMDKISNTNPPVKDNLIYEMVNELIMANDMFAQVYILQGVVIGLGLKSNNQTGDGQC